MKNFRIIILFLFSYSVYGQTMKNNSVIDTENGIIGFSISALRGMKIVTSFGKTFYSPSFDSAWQKISSVYPDTSDIDNPTLEKASFFNNDTAIVTGYIDGDDGYSKCGLYLTIDGGRSWKIINYGGDDWIYDAFVDRYGHAWIGGSSGEIFYSKDFGQHWEKLNSPFVNPELRVKSISMLNSNVGIAGALFNAIYMTTNNWKTSKKIETPFTQYKYNSKLGDSYQDINKIQLWKNYIVVNQYGYFFWSDLNNPNWKEFPIKITDFNIDPNSQRLLAITDDEKLVAFTSPTDFKYLSNENIHGEIKTANNRIYIINAFEIMKLDSRGLTRRLLFSGNKITDVNLNVSYKNLTWGYNDISLYLSNDGGNEWYREKVLHKDIVDIKPLTDSTAILRDCVNRNFIYTLKTHTFSTYYFKRPIDGFLQSKISSIDISSGNESCEGFYLRSNVKYQIKDGINLSSDRFTESNSNEDTSLIYVNKIESIKLLNVLKSINLNPNSIPSINDFEITMEDKKNYFNLVDEYLITNPIDIFEGKRKISKSFFYSVPDRLNSINQQMLSRIFDKQESIWSTDANVFKIVMINESNDTLHISSRYYEKARSWNIPWVIEYKGKVFNCNSIALSKLIKASIPNGFVDKKYFDNKYLIMEIADYLYNK